MQAAVMMPPERTADRFMNGIDIRCPTFLFRFCFFAFSLLLIVFFLIAFGNQGRFLLLLLLLSLCNFFGKILREISRVDIFSILAVVMLEVVVDVCCFDNGAGCRYGHGDVRIIVENK